MLLTVFVDVNVNVTLCKKKKEQDDDDDDDDDDDEEEEEEEEEEDGEDSGSNDESGIHRIPCIMIMNHQPPMKHVSREYHINGLWWMEYTKWNGTAGLAFGCGAR